MYCTQQFEVVWSWKIWLERTFWVRSNFPEVVCRPSSLWDTSPIQLFESHCQNSQLYSYSWQVINRQMGISIPEMIANQIYSKLWVFELQGPKFQVERPSFERVMVSPYQHKIGFSTYSKMKFFPLFLGPRNKSWSLAKGCLTRIKIQAACLIRSPQVLSRVRYQKSKPNLSTFLQKVLPPISEIEPNQISILYYIQHRWIIDEHMERTREYL